MFGCFNKKNIDKGLDKIEYSLNFVETKILPTSKKLEEITDDEIVDKINKYVPKAAEYVKKTVNVGKQVSKVFEMVISKEDIVNNVEKVSNESVSNSINSIFNNVNVAGGIAVLSIGVMIVSVYQTHKVSRKLSSVSMAIDDIHNFQLVEYHNSVKSLIFDITNILENKTLLFKKKEIRLRELSNLDRYEHECERLLGQSIDMIDSSLKKEHKTFEDYIKATNSINEWITYLSILSDTLKEIAELKYALNLGSASEDYCFNKYKKIYRSIDKTFINLKDWHNKNINRFEIDFDNKKYRRDGIAKLFKNIQNLKKDNKIIYGDINDNDIITIKGQLEYKNNTTEENNDNVVVVIKDGKYYFAD